MARTLVAPASGSSAATPRRTDWPADRGRHFPPGTSKWNKIEHRLFSFISTNWRGKPLISHEVIINLISNTTTSTGLKVYAQLDDREYEKGIKVSDEQLATINISRNPFHGDWNYTMAPSHAKS